MRERWLRRLVAAATLTCALLPTHVASGHTDDHVSVATWGPRAVEEALDVGLAVHAGERFLATYVDADGRVVRRDHGGDTVSEGQGYAMTIAAAIGDEATFGRVWRWTERELRRDDGLFSWHWRDGAVVDTQSAADADLFIAGALSLAAKRFGDPALAAAARSTSQAILEHETVRVGGRRVLVAGHWAVGEGVFNPSYAATPIMSRLWWDGDRGWAGVAAGSRLAIDQLTAAPPHLPPDWATVAADGGELRTMATGDPPHYGWDAVRVPVQLAADCDDDGRRVAARMWPFFLGRAVVVGAVYATDGTVVDPSTHTAALVGAAGAANAWGAGDSADVLLARATAWDVEHPTYYGSAWVALGRMWLTTSLLGGCADR